MQTNNNNKKTPLMWRGLNYTLLNDNPRPFNTSCQEHSHPQEASGALSTAQLKESWMNYLRKNFTAPAAAFPTIIR